MENYFSTLNNINVNDKSEKKNGLTYLSWAWAWGEVKKLHADANYKIYENADGWNYFTDGKTCWVKTGVIVNGIEHIEYLPIMDLRNKSITLDNVTSFNVNKAIQRSLTKACARHGLGLYIYAGEDLPESEDVPVKMATVEQIEKPKAQEWKFADGRYKGLSMIDASKKQDFEEYIQLLKDANKFKGKIEEEYTRVSKFYDMSNKIGEIEV